MLSVSLGNSETRRLSICLDVSDVFSAVLLTVTKRENRRRGRSAGSGLRPHGTDGQRSIRRPLLLTLLQLHVPCLAASFSCTYPYKELPCVHTQSAWASSLSPRNAGSLVPLPSFRTAETRPSKGALRLLRSQHRLYGEPELLLSVGGCDKTVEPIF